MKQWMLPGLTLACLLAAGLGWFFLRPRPESTALQSRQLACRALAEHLARAFPGKSALVVANPFAREADAARGVREADDAGQRGLREGFGAAVRLAAVAHPQFKPGARENPRAFIGGETTITPMSYLVAEDAFDRLLEQHTGAEIVVSLIGLPADLNAFEAWHKAPPPRFALLFPDVRLLGGTTALGAALRSGRLAAVVLRKPGGVDEETPVRGEAQVVFAERYLLVTAENFDGMREQFPAAFASP
jgi:hypothetical protein